MNEYSNIEKQIQKDVAKYNVDENALRLKLALNGTYPIEEQEKNKQ